MSAEQVARAHQQGRRLLSDLLGRLARRLWEGLSPADLDGSWAQAAPALLLGLSGAQLAAARQADDYVTAALLEQGISPAAAGDLDPTSLAGVASDGRPLDSLLRNPITVVKTGIAGGAGVEQSMAAGYTNLDLIVRTQLADAGRAADQVALTSRPAATGYVRMLSGKSCGRCAILAGRWYAYNAGFDRHPRCDCVHVPARESANEIRTNPRAYFESLSKAEQDKAFTKAGAEAIRLGADPIQVVNARKGAYGLTPASARITAEEARILRGGRDVGRLETRRVFGQDLFVTTEGTTTRGLAGRRLGANETGQKVKGQRYRRAKAPRLMPESIIAIAKDRDDAIRLLKRFGYIR